MEFSKEDRKKLEEFKVRVSWALEQLNIPTISIQASANVAKQNQDFQPFLFIEHNCEDSLTTTLLLYLVRATVNKQIEVLLGEAGDDVRNILAEIEKHFGKSLQNVIDQSGTE